MTRGKWLGATILCASAMAFAAPVSASVPGFNWTGFYIGGHAGGSWDNNNLSFRDTSVEHDLSIHGGDDNGFMGGVHGGVNWTAGGNWVWGIEGDGGFGSDVDYLASVRARLGWAGGHCLFYVTGGAGFIGQNEDFTVVSEDDGPTHFSRDRNESGWVGGFGFEWPIADNLTFGAEGLYYNFGGDTSHLVTPFGETFTISDDSNFWVARARLTWYVNN